MHAIVCHEHGEPDVMQYVEIPQPVPSAGEVLIQAEAIGVNYVDTMRRSGRHPAAPKTPFTPGIEVCGRVAQVGEGVQQFQTGDRVIGRCVTHGSYAEYVAVEERFTVACPEGTSSEQGAALFVTGQTAFHALVTMGGIAADENVLITAAAGGVGSCAVQVAKRLGANVIAAAGSPAKCELAKNIGADFVVDYSQSDWPQTVLDLTDGKGAALIIESVGGAVAKSCIRCWSPGGRLVIYGKASGEPATVSGDDLLFGNRRVYGLAVGTVIEDESLMRAAMDQLLEWLGQDQLKLPIGKVYALHEAAQAHIDLESRQTTGKLVLKPAG
ncbi:MAG: alcohol dehydrogenase [Planctomycetaceae bacterium]|nr:alcohol dehydrogenase [Planctomycetaceae bacterium]